MGKRLLRGRRGASEGDRFRAAPAGWRERWAARREDRWRQAIAESAETHGWTYGRQMPVALLRQLQSVEPLAWKDSGLPCQIVTLDFGGERYWVFEQTWWEGQEPRWSTTFLGNAPMKAAAVRFRLVGGRVHWHTRKALYRPVDGLPKELPAVRGLIDGDWIVATLEGRLRPEWLMPGFESLCALVDRMRSAPPILAFAPPRGNKFGGKSYEIAA